MPEVVGEAGSVDDIRVEPEALGELPTDLRHLERMREAVAGKVEPHRWTQHLSLRSKAAQRARVHQPRTVASKVAAAA
jgi:hypothetical protein